MAIDLRRESQICYSLRDPIHDKSDELTLLIAILLLIFGTLILVRPGTFSQLSARTGLTSTWIRVIAGTALLLGGSVLLGMSYFVRTFSRAASGQ